MNFGLTRRAGDDRQHGCAALLKKRFTRMKIWSSKAQRYPAKSPRTSNKKPLILVFTRATFPNLWARLVCPMLILPWSSASWAEARWR